MFRAIARCSRITFLTSVSFHSIHFLSQLFFDSFSPLPFWPLLSLPMMQKRKRTTTRITMVDGWASVIFRTTGWILSRSAPMPTTVVSLSTAWKTAINAKPSARSRYTQAGWRDLFASLNHSVTARLRKHRRSKWAIYSAGTKRTKLSFDFEYHLGSICSYP